MTNIVTGDGVNGQEIMIMDMNENNEEVAAGVQHVGNGEMESAIAQ